MLIIFSGLPGTGKTTITKEVTKHLKAVYLRVDTIEQTLKNLEGYPDSLVIGSEGYLVSYAIAKENLALGIDVVADSVNPIAITRHDWRQVAKETNTVFIEIELICSDKKEHQDRVEKRVADIEGHKLPTWKEVVDRDYEPWSSASLQIDTSKHTVDEAVQKIMEFIIFETPRSFKWQKAHWSTLENTDHHNPIKILAISGSLRKASSNTAMLQAAASISSKMKNIEIIVFPLLALEAIPHFNPDCSMENLPLPVARFRDALIAVDGILIASPEYAGGVAGALKDSLDWMVGSARTEIYGKPFALLNISNRATEAYEDLCRIVKTMGGNLIESASVTISLVSNHVTVDTLLQNTSVVDALKAVIYRFIEAIRE